MDPTLLPMLMRMFGPQLSSMLAGSGAMPPDQGPPVSGMGPVKDTSQVPGLPTSAPMSGSGMPLDQGPPLSGMGPAEEAGAALGGPAGYAPQGPELPGNFGGSPANNPNLQPTGSPPAAQPGGVEKMLAALRGVQVPKPPEPQRVSTPANPGRAPAMAAQPGLLQLLQMMTAGHPPSAQMSLGQALSGRG